MASAWWLSALLVVALLSGCATSSGTEGDASEDPGVDVTPTATTGVIRGVVVDAASSRWWAPLSP
ncbi:MAG: hypothetical protein AABX89_06120 [Candidatus Thermoplasmatota archaeon]